MATASASIDTFRACGWRTVSFRAADMAAASAAMTVHHPERALVASCQRLEAYGFGDCDCPAPERWTGREAVARLAEIAAGLDSVVLGEDQILGQVRAALASAPGSVRQTGDLAIAAARQLRRETAFDSHAGHLLDRALRLGDIRPPGTLLILGAGSLGRLIAARGLQLGFAVTVAGRTPPTSAQPWRFARLADLDPDATFDVLAGCLGSGAGEIRLDAVPRAQLTVDLGTPRNFAEDAGREVITVADLLADEASRPHAAQRRAELRGRLGALVDERLAGAAATSDTAVGALRAEVERIRLRELQRTRRLHPELPADVLDAMTRSLVDQIFHAPTARLRDFNDESLARALAGLFANEPGI